MTESPPGQGPAPAEDPLLESLVAQCAERMEREGEGALSDLCRRHPHLAEDLRRRIASLRDVRLLPAGRPKTIGPYHLLEEIGEGGMGTVFLAEQREPVRRRVALKVIKLGMDSKAVLARFEAERQALALMEHSCVARIYDAGVAGTGQPYFAMEYVKGVPITEYCDQHRLDLHARMELFRQVCSGVQHAHLKGVMHRDLKPSNILVTVQDGRPMPKIIDFGLAKAMDHRLVEATLFTERGQIVGTPEYMSPEQAGLGGLDVDTRTDVYSLGVLLYELLTGQLPFSREALRKAGLLEMQRIIREAEPQRPSTRITGLGERAAECALRRAIAVGDLRQRLRGDLDWIVMKALEKDRTRRYETALELAADLDRHIRFEPVLASPPSIRYRTGRLLRRYRGAAIAAGLVLLAIVGGSISTVVFALHANTKAEEARLAKDQLAVEVEDAKAARDAARQAAAELEQQKLTAQSAREAAEKALRDYQEEQQKKAELEERMRRKGVEAAARDNEARYAARLNEERASQSAREAVALERLQTIDLQFDRARQAVSARTPSTADASPDGDAELLLLHSAQWEDRPRWTALVRGRALAMRGQEQAVQVLQAALPARDKSDERSAVLLAAIHRTIAAAHLQADAAPLAMAAYMEAMQALSGIEWMLSAARSELALRTSRETAWLMLETPARNPWRAAPVRESRQDQPTILGIAAQLAMGSCLQAVRPTLAAARSAVDRGSTAQPTPPPPELAAHALRRLGQVESALQHLRADRAPAGSATLRTAYVVEEARAWLAVHRPTAAVEVLEQHLARCRDKGEMLLLPGLLHELRASCHANLGQHELALGALADAAAAAAGRDAAASARLSRARGDVLRWLGRTDRSLEAHAGHPIDDLPRNFHRLPLAARLQVAEVSALGGQTMLAEQALASAIADAAKASTEDRLALRMLQSRDLLARGRLAEAAKALDAVENILLAVVDPWLQARAQVDLAAGLVALGKGRAALPYLDRAARSWQQWLLDYGRFRGEPLGAARLETAQSLGRSAIGVLADLATTWQDEDLFTVWRVLETFRAPVDAILGTRPASLRAPGFDAREYESARTAWLDRELQTDAAPTAPGGRGNRVRENDERLQRLEDRLRAESPAYAAAVLPRIASLAEARRALPEGTALVVFATTGARAVAFVLTRSGAELVPMTVPGDAGSTRSAAMLERLGTDLVAPLLACRTLSDASSWRRLLIAPADALHAVPFEWCAVPVAGNAADRQPLLQRCEVACVPSGSAWFAQQLAQRSARRKPAGGTATLFAAGEDATQARPWLATALRPADAERGTGLIVVDDPTAVALRQAASSARTLGLSLPLDLHLGVGPMSARVAAASPAHPDGRITQQDLRDLGVALDLAVVHAARVPSDPIAEAGALAGFARGLWSSGTALVVTASGSCAHEPGIHLVAAVATARRSGDDAIGAWCEAARQVLRRGVPATDLCGLRIWSVDR